MAISTQSLSPGVTSLYAHHERLMMLFSCDTCRAYLTKVLLDNTISQGLALCV